MNEIIRDDEDYNIQNRLIYLDSSASSDPEAKVYADMMTSLMHDWNNPSSIYEQGKAVRRKVEHAREQVRKFINAKDEDQIIFGSCASEMIALGLNNNYYVLSSYVEHPSLYNRHQNRTTAKSYNRYHGKIKIQTNRYGYIDLKQLDLALSYYCGNEEKVVAIAGVNSEIGIIQDIDSIVSLAHRHYALVLIDWSQGAGHLPIDVQKSDIDMLVMTSEKCGCFRGCGVLYAKKDIKIVPLWYGGPQEKVRPGTENTASIISFGNQLERIQNSFDERQEREWDIRYKMKDAIDNACEGICEWHVVPFLKMQPKTINYVPNILSCMFTGIDNQQLLTMLDINGVQCSAGSACSAGERKPSRVLKSIGLSNDEAMNVLRFSFDYRLKDEEIEEFGRRLRKCLTALKMIEG